MANRKREGHSKRKRESDIYRERDKKVFVTQARGNHLRSRQFLVVRG